VVGTERNTDRSPGWFVIALLCVGLGLGSAFALGCERTIGDDDFQSIDDPIVNPPPPPITPGPNDDDTNQGNS